MAQLINGKELAEKLQQNTAKEVEALNAQGIQPSLVVLLVGENAASQVYVRNKERAAKKTGIHSVVMRYPEAITEDALIKEIEQFNRSKEFHGILVQLPLPDHID
ncbi:MAG: tetrahydrofolate dehydrogenase/cyclohydrolase catalytic domain-containing protein, partial [Enterococcus viikkiensis]